MVDITGIDIGPSPDPPEPLAPWISGLRPRIQGRDWRHAVAAVILLDLAGLTPTEKTSAAEKGLGIESSLYWYILRSEEMYGYVVFSWRAKIDGWRPPEGGLCPFDSGGLWHGHLRTDPALMNEAAKREFFGRHDQNLCEWNKAFREYLSANYSHASDYINGIRPRVGIPEILKTPNSPQAWTWEARVYRDSFRAGRVELQSLYWHRAQWDYFLNWVEIESNYDDSTQEKMVEWVQDHAILCSPAESPAKRAAADLLDRFRR